MAEQSSSYIPLDDSTIPSGSREALEDSTKIETLPIEDGEMRLTADQLAEIDGYLKLIVNDGDAHPDTQFWRVRKIKDILGLKM